MENFSNPKISIVMPLFNSEKFIETAVESVLLQTFKDFELLLIADCSTDSTLEIVSKYDDPRIKIIHQIKNSGESSSRNLGIEVANGKYIYFMDHDDMILPETLEIFINAAEESQAEVAYMNSYFRGEDLTGQLEQIRCTNPKPRIMSSDLTERIKFEFMHRDVTVEPWIKIQRRDFLIDKQIRFPLITRDGDGMFNLAEICFAKKIQVIDACCYLYRLTPTQTMASSAEKHLRQTINSMPLMLEFMENVFDKLPISTELRLAAEERQIMHMLDVFVLRSYRRGELKIETIDQILRELKLTNLTRVLIHTIATKMIQSEKKPRKFKQIFRNFLSKLRM